MRPTVLSAALYAKNQAAIDVAHTLFQANQENWSPYQPQFGYTGLG